VCVRVCGAKAGACTSDSNSSRPARTPDRNPKTPRPNPALLSLTPNFSRPRPDRELHSKRYFSVKEAYEEGLVDKLIPGYKLNRFRKIARDTFGDREAFYGADKPKFRFARQAGDQA